MRSLESTVGVSSYQIVSFGQWMVNTQLKLDSIRTSVTISPTFDRTQNILDLYYEIPNAKPICNIEGLVK